MRQPKSRKWSASVAALGGTAEDLKEKTNRYQCRFPLFDIDNVDYKSGLILQEIQKFSAGKGARSAFLKTIILQKHIFMKRISSTESSKLDRKTVEKNRRTRMKALLSNLFSVIPPQHFKPSLDVLSDLDKLTHVISYIEELKERVEEMKKTRLKTTALTIEEKKKNLATSSDQPFIELKEMGSVIEVNLINGSKKNFIFLPEIIYVLEEEGANVINASFFTVGKKIFHTVHAEVKVSRVGVDTSRVRERLLEMIL